MDIAEFILPNKDFQTSVNIDYDFSNEAKVESLVVTNTVGRYLEELLQDVMAPSNQRAKLLIGSYGKGKSHIVLSALHVMWKKGTKEGLKLAQDMKTKGLAFADSFALFANEGQRLLPVIVSGSSSDLQRSMLYALRNALRRENLAHLMPNTNYDAAIAVMNRWREEYPDTFQRFEAITGENGNSVIDQLSQMNERAYEQFVEVYPKLTSGSRFDKLDGANPIEVYTTVLEALNREGISGIYIVYDEFSKYLEASIADTSVSDIRFLQDFAEACNRSTQSNQLHLLLISHKSLENYIDSKLSKDKVDGWRGVSGRFREIVMIDDFNQYYELIQRAIIKDDAKWRKWLNAKNQNNSANLTKVYERYLKQGLFIGSENQDIAEGCYPLHPMTTYILPRMSERAAQNERTLFTFLCGNDDNALMQIKECITRYVMPDQIYDYFEPQLRKEFYTSPLHKVYELARASLSRLKTNDDLEARIIKTIAAMDVLAQYDRLPPTKAAIIELYLDDGYNVEDIDEAISKLVEVESIVYLKRSNSYLKLKESSGVKIEAEIAERAESIKREMSSIEILNEVIEGKSLYPSRYNDDYKMVRFFDCKFRTLDQIKHWNTPKAADGEMAALYPFAPEDINECRLIAERQRSEDSLLVIAVPKKYLRIDDELYRLKAAKSLKEESRNDEVLAEEYELAVEDYNEIVDEFVAMYFQPELGRVAYYSKGEAVKAKRKHHLSNLLSLRCEEAYSRAPKITSEALNKNQLTGTAFSSRTRILKAIFSHKNKKDLGFVGNGQETSMMRSALVRTGVVDGNLKPDMEPAMEAIERFVEDANGQNFGVIYNILTGRDEHIGMRRGPISIYLAWVLADCADAIKVTHNGEERPLCAELIDDISEHPEEYEITRINWTPEKSEYTKGLAALFGCADEHFTRHGVADAIRRWYIELPQVVRNRNWGSTSKERDKFFRAIKQLTLDDETLLYEKIPYAFGVKQIDNCLVGKVRNEKECCDRCLAETFEEIKRGLIEVFEPNAHKDATLGSVLHGWIEEHPLVQTIVFNGAENQLIKTIVQANGNDTITLNRLAKVATGLRVEDWNDERFSDFFDAIASVKSTVEGAVTDACEIADEKKVTITFVEEGVARERTFEKAQRGKRAKMLQRQIESCLADMGDSMNPGEKRQVIFDVLKELC